MTDYTKHARKLFDKFEISRDVELLPAVVDAVDKAQHQKRISSPALVKVRKVRNREWHPANKDSTGVNSRYAYGLGAYGAGRFGIGGGEHTTRIKGSSEDEDIVEILKQALLDLEGK